MPNEVAIAAPIAGKVRTGFPCNVRDAGLPEKVTPGSLLQTAATWLTEAGVGMTVQTLEKRRAHRRPDCQISALPTKRRSRG